MATRRPDPQAAPGDLEIVRTLLNSWRIPNDTRAPADMFEQFLRSAPPAFRREATALRTLRDDLRAGLDDADRGDARLNAWIRRLRLLPVVAEGGLGFDGAGGAPGRILAIVIAAIAAGRWQRLKACPDCRWVFYDHTRNGSKRWCLMYAGGPHGRACGTIAKVRRYRQRHRPPGPGRREPPTSPS